MGHGSEGKFGRRDFLRWTGSAGLGLAVWPLGGRSSRADVVFKEIHEMQPGEFTWHPERSPEGPVAIVVSIPDQRVHVFRNGIRIAVSTCSTGKSGHETPTGVFTILQKDKHHRSSTYNNAPMPNMNRLTWDGVALHAGKLPGYPASHGCVRLPLEFSEKLFTVTHVGTPVIVAGAHSDPEEVVHPGMVLGDYAEHEFEDAVAGLKAKSLPADSHEENTVPPTSVLISGWDKRVFVLENGTVVAEGEARIKAPELPLGSHVFILNETDDSRQGLEWHAIPFHHDVGAELVQPGDRVLRRLGAEPHVRHAIKERMHPGMILVTTDLPAHPETRSASDFVILTQEST